MKTVPMDEFDRAVYERNLRRIEEYTNFHKRYFKKNQFIMEEKSPFFGIMRLSPRDLSPVFDEVEKILENDSDFLNVNGNLAGNLKNSYELTKCVDHLGKILTPLASRLNDNINVIKGNVDFKLDTCWVNFQEKNDFNPMHTHNGDFSFVLWLKVPFLIQNELMTPKSIRSNSPSAGCFQFYYTSYDGKINDILLPIDKKMEGCLAVFPAKLPHSVFPFTTSNEYRISISGNMIHDIY